MIDNHHNIYAAATLLYPTIRLARFKRNWVGVLKPWIQIMEVNCRETWINQYLPLLPKDPFIRKSDDSYTRKVIGLPRDDKIDEFNKYNQDITSASNLNTFNPIKW
jgi:hypothetical protein